MAMVNIQADFWLAQVYWLGPEVGSHRRCFCIHRVNRMNREFQQCSDYVGVVSERLLATGSYYQNCPPFQRSILLIPRIAMISRYVQIPLYHITVDGTAAVAEAIFLCLHAFPPPGIRHFELNQTSFSLSDD